MLTILRMVAQGWQFDTYYHDHAYYFRLNKGSITTVVSSKRVTGNAHLNYILSKLATNASNAANTLAVVGTFTAQPIQMGDQQKD